MKDPKRKILSETFQVTLAECEISSEVQANDRSESPEVNDPRRKELKWKAPSEIYQAKLGKQSNNPKRKNPTESRKSSKRKFQTNVSILNDSKRKFPSQKSQAKVINHKF